MTTTVALRARVLIEEAHTLGLELTDLIAAETAGATRIPTVTSYLATIEQTFTPATVATYRPYWRLVIAVLEARHLNVRFGEHHAVRDVSLSVAAGSIVGLIGPNGAGKTTTFNALSGVQRCTGTVRLGGVDVSSLPPHRRARLGMNRTFQRLEVVGSMTAYDNIRTAAEITARAHKQPVRGALAIADQVVELLGLQRIAHQRADSLPTGQARLVELGRALATNPKVVLLDEPASGLDDVETGRLAEVLASLAEQQMAVLLVEHDIDLVMSLCSTICVLNFGALIAVGTPEKVRADAQVREAYLGAMV